MNSVKENSDSNIMSNESNNESFLDVQRVYMIYKARSEQASIVALKGSSFSVDQGQILSLVGPSGSGKSSLFNIIGGILKPTAGSVIFEGKDITKLSEEALTNFRKKELGFVFQDGNLLPKISTFENVNEAMAFNDYPYEYRKKRTNELLKLVGVHNRKNQLALKLSGGEKQRVAIARALANSPKIILADEPTGNVDYSTGIQILELFKYLNNEQGMTFLLATHSNTVSKYAERILEIRDGMIIGQHGKGVDITKLDMSRMVMVDFDYRVSIPENIIESLGIEQGSLWVANTKDNEIVFSSIESQTKRITESRWVKLLDTQTLECLVCGSENPFASKFCSSCGAKF